MLIYSQLHNAGERVQVYKPRRGGAGHVWRRWALWRHWALGASALKMRDNQSSVRDCGTVMFFAGQSRGMWDGWQVCKSSFVEDYEATLLL